MCFNTDYYIKKCGCSLHLIIRKFQIFFWIIANFRIHWPNKASILIWTFKISKNMNYGLKHGEF